MYCLKCGKEIADNVAECPYCGCMTENSANVQEIETAITNDSTSKTLITLSFVIAGIGIVVAWFFALLGYVCFGVGLAFALMAKSKGANKNKSTIAVVVSCVALLCSIISSIIGAVMMM